MACCGCGEDQVREQYALLHSSALYCTLLHSSALHHTADSVPPGRRCPESWGGGGLHGGGAVQGGSLRAREVTSQHPTRPARVGGILAKRRARRKPLTWGERHLAWLLRSTVATQHRVVNHFMVLYTFCTMERFCMMWYVLV